MKFDPFLFANICVGVAGICYLLACAGFVYARHYWWAGAYANYSLANVCLIAVALKALHDRL